jgi:hypothetical protein
MLLPDSTDIMESKEQYLIKLNQKMNETIRWKRYNLERKPTWAALLWSHFIPGAGHFYCDNKISGTLFAAGTTGSLVLIFTAKSEKTKSAGLSAFTILHLSDMMLAIVNANDYNNKLKQKYNLIISHAHKNDYIGIKYCCDL